MLIDYALTVLNQIFIMSLLMLAGLILTKCGVISEGGTQQISTLLMKIIMPCMIISSFTREFDLQMCIQLLQTLVLIIIAYAVPIFIARVCYKKNAEKSLSLVLSNNGFMAIPMLQALLGTPGVFLGSIHIVAGNIATWTYGVYMHGAQKKSKAWKMILLNPGTLALIIGLLFFVSPIKPPSPFTDAIAYLGSANTPLAMLLLGAYLARLNIKSCFKDKSLLFISAAKLVIIPLLILLIYKALPFGAFVCSAALIGSATPTGMSAPMIAQYCKRDYQFSTGAVTFTTLLSIVTMPIILTIMQFILK